MEAYFPLCYFFLALNKQITFMHEFFDFAKQKAFSLFTNIWCLLMAIQFRQHFFISNSRIPYFFFVKSSFLDQKNILINPLCNRNCLHDVGFFPSLSCLTWVVFSLEIDLKSYWSFRQQIEARNMCFMLHDDLHNLQFVFRYQKPQNHQHKSIVEINFVEECLLVYNFALFNLTKLFSSCAIWLPW